MTMWAREVNIKTPMTWEEEKKYYSNIKDIKIKIKYCTVRFNFLAHIVENKTCYSCIHHRVFNKIPWQVRYAGYRGNEMFDGYEEGTPVEMHKCLVSEKELDFKEFASFEENKKYLNCSNYQINSFILEQYNFYKIEFDNICKEYEKEE